MCRLGLNFVAISAINVTNGYILYAQNPCKMSYEDGLTSLRVSKRNRDRLAKRGTKNETFDEIVSKALNEPEKNSGSQQ